MGSAPTPTRSDAVSTLALFALLSAAPFLAAPWSAGLFVGAVGITATWARRGPPAVLHFGVLVSVLLGLLAIPGAWLTWPGPMILALVLYWAARRWLPEDPNAFSRGAFDRRSTGLMVLFVILSASALLGWWWLFERRLDTQPKQKGPTSSEAGPSFETLEPTAR